MTKYSGRLLSICILISLSTFGQRLKKADRTIVSNIKTHISHLHGAQQKASGATSQAASEYIGKQFARHGLKPAGDQNSWYQQFEIYDGMTVLPETRLTINGKPLQLFEDYFPFTFSANKEAESAVAIALAEDGFPWFKDLREITDSGDSTRTDTIQAIRQKAEAAAQKGATALLIYNSTNDPDLVFDKYALTEPVSIPVLYINHGAFKKHCSDESAIVDIDMKVATKSIKRKGTNIIGYANNNADRTVVTFAHLNKDTGIAALMEVARLLKPAQVKNTNYLFVVYSGEQNGLTGSDHFKKHPTVKLQPVNYSLNMDTITVEVDNRNGLALVKRGVELIKNN